MDNGALLKRIAQTLKTEVGPAVEGDYPKTQAFMAAVVLQKLGAELSTHERHRDAEAADRALLADALEAFVESNGLQELIGAAVAAFSAEPGDRQLSQLIDTLYRSREALGQDCFTALRARIRETLRQSIDRRMEYAG